jgi:hypothetical protein
MNAMLQAFIRNAQLVLTRPSTASFDAAGPFANWNVILVALAIAAVARGILGAISAAYMHALFFGFGNPAHYVYSPVGTFFGDAIGTFIGFFIGVGILFVIALLFQGRGSFLSYAYALALISIPVTIADAALGLIPILGGLATIALAVYSIYLAILATASVHQMPMNRAIWVVLIPVLVGILLAICAIAVIGTTIFALSRNR